MAEQTAVGTDTKAPRQSRNATQIGSRMCGVLSVGFLIAALLAADIETGSKAEWLSGIGTLTAVVVALWQTITIQKQAKEQAHEAQKHFERELMAAEERSARELKHARTWEFKLVLIQLSKVIKAYRDYLGRLAEAGLNAYTFSDKAARQDALLEVRQEATAHDVSSEIVDALLLAQDDAIRQSLRQIQPLMVESFNADMRYRFSVRQGQEPDPSEILDSLRDIEEAIDSTRQIAAERLDTDQ